MDVRLFLIGFGNVGWGIADLLVEKRDELRDKYGLNFIVTGIATWSHGTLLEENGLNLVQVLESVDAGVGFKSCGYPIQLISTEEAMEKVPFDVLLELSVTNLKDGNPAFLFIRKALEWGKHVVTTNKGPIALHLDSLQKLAKKQGVALKYEGTVMAGTPLLNLIEKNLAGLEINKIEGILNGSTNFILTRMEEGLEYEEAVEEARGKGILEADASADLDGWDATAKVMILAQAVFGQGLDVRQVQRQGISHLRREDILRARAADKVWKLIARVEKVGKRVEASVQPEMVDRDHPLAKVKGTMNAATIFTDYLQEVTIFGPGAGRHETGFAVLNDLLSIFAK